MSAENTDENLDMEETLADYASLIATPDSFIKKKMAREALVTPWNFKVIGIFYPELGFAQEEVEALSEFVKEGGGLLLTGERGDKDRRSLHLNDISTKFGITFKPDRIFDPIHSYAGSADGGPALMSKKKDFIKITKFADHTISEGVKEVAYFEGCSLDCPKEGHLAWSDSMSFADENADGAWSVGEKIGSLPIAGFATMGKGRVVCVGDTSLFTRRTLKNADNKLWTHNMVKWLAKGKVAQVKVAERTLTPTG